MADAESLPPSSSGSAETAARRTPRGLCWMLTPGQGCRLGQEPAFTPRLALSLCSSSSPCHGAATLTLISTGLQLTEAERGGSGFFSVCVVTVELVQSF